MTGFVYFVKAPTAGMVKIGKTVTSLEKRIRALQCGSPIPLELAAHIRLGSRNDIFDANRLALKVEWILHARHDADRTHGEWFVLSEAIQRDIDAINDGSFNWFDLPSPEILENGYYAKKMAMRAESIRIGRRAQISLNTNC